MRQFIDRQTDKQELVTFFKGIAILMVILVHAAQSFELPKWLAYPSQLGQFGCQIFFVLSAYTLCFSMEKKPRKLLDFMRRRYIRIVPGYWTMILIYFVLGLLAILFLNGHLFSAVRNWKYFLPNLFLINGLTIGRANNSVVRGGWYVGTSMILYWLTPLLFKLFTIEKKWWTGNRIWLFPLIATLVSSAFGVGIYYLNPELLYKDTGFWYFFFLNQLPCYALGFSLYDWKRRGKRAHPAVIGTVGTVSLIGSVWLFFSQRPLAYLFYHVAFALFFCCLFVAISSFCCPAHKKYNIIVCRFGERSYAIYLFHSLIVYEGAIAYRFAMDRIPFAVLHSEIAHYFIWLPIALISIYWLGRLFTLYLDKIDLSLKALKIGRETKNI